MDLHVQRLYGHFRWVNMHGGWSVAVNAFYEARVAIARPMSIIAEFHVSADDCLLQRTLRERPDLRLEAERTVGYNRETFMPFLWVTGDELTGIEAILREDPTVRAVTPLDTFDAASLYEFDWHPDAESVVHAIPDTGVAVLNARGRSDTWEIQMRFADRDALAAFRTECDENDIALVTRWTMHPEGPKGPRQHDLTPTQRDTLLAAFELGYFDIPRTISLDELADELGISHQSASERLRRGYAHLVQDTLHLDGSDTRPSDEGDSGERPAGE